MAAGSGCSVRKSLIVIAAFASGLTAMLGTSSWSAPGQGAVRQPVVPSALSLSSLSPTGVPTLDEKHQVFSKVWQLFETYYPNFKMKGIDWLGERAKYQPKALAAATWPAFFGILNQMISDLDDPHCYLTGAPMPTTYIPLVGTALARRQVVVVASSNPARIPVGSIVTGVNGSPISRRLDRSVYSKGSLEAGVAAAFMTTSSNPETLSLWIPSTNRVRQVTVSVYATTGRIPSAVRSFAKKIVAPIWAFSPGGTYGSPIASGARAFRVAHLQNDVLYVYIPAMAPPVTTPEERALTDEFRRVLKLAESAKGLIVDIRGNPGGDMWPGLWFARHLYNRVETPAEVRFPKRYDPTLPHELANGTEYIPLKPVSSATASPDFTQWGVMQLSPLTPHVSVPIALLTDGWNASAAENFVVFMQSAPNVETFGDTTMGADGSPRAYPVMKGVQVLISSWQERIMATGLPVEGFGLPPDHRVNVSYSDFVNETIRAQQGDPQETMSHDPVVQAALAWIRQKVDR